MSFLHSGHENLSVFFVSSDCYAQSTAMNLPASLSKVRTTSSHRCEPDAKGLRSAEVFLHLGPRPSENRPNPLDLK